ncbi:MAG TPA: chromosome segregation protein SMC [Methylomirabilota bacterium]|nr:chromosome segregation protein SMC [Methylomirabilota bacterium]
MRLESILIHGFKSFAEKTDVKVFPGVTCIVGPNGCGKSNVADAIRWALGEQSPKTLRGAKMEDVIFHGSSSRKMVGMAEVSLVFNNDGGLSVPWSEVAVARRLYRTGESEYLLNTNVCRLRDIQDLFAGTGVNPKAYALMDQERLNHVLTAKPWERRMFIEEAAGIARYKQQRAETQGKLDATRLNLQRLRDVMEEVRRQLSSIERQARKAQQYKALQTERQGLDLALLAADYAARAAQHEAVTREMESLRGTEEQQRVRIATLTGRQALQAAAIQDIEYRLGDLRQSVQKIQGEAERLLERREQMGLQIQDLVAEERRLEEEIRGLAERRIALATEREDKDRGLEEARRRHIEQDGEVRQVEIQIEACRSALSDRRERFEALRLEQIRVAGARAELTRSGGELRERRVQVDRRAERLALELAAARVEADALATTRLRLEAASQRAGAQLSLLSTELQEIEAARRERETARAAAQEAAAGLRVKLAARQSALEALERLEREREGYGAGVRAMFARPGAADLGGVVGTVADLLEVPNGLEAAVEAVLGDRLQWVVVERFEHARAALGYLEREGAGAATLLPLETLPAASTVPDDSGEVSWAARLVGGPRPALLHYLLGRVGIVSHLDQAETLWRRNGVVATYVTRSGEVLSPSGRLTGGHRDSERQSNDHSLLGRKRAIRQLAEEIAGLERDVAAAAARAETIEGEVTGLRTRLEGLQSNYQAQETARVSGEKDLESVLRESDRVARHLETLTVESEQLAGEGEETASQLVELERALLAASEQEARLGGDLAALQTLLESGQGDEAGFTERLTVCRVDLATVAERVEALGRDIERILGLEQDFGLQQQQSVARRAQTAERRGDLAAERERTDAQAREAVAERDRLEAEVAVIAEEHQRQLDERQAIETDLREVQQQLSDLIGRLHQLDLTETEGRVRREELAQEARRRHAIETVEALLAAHDAARDLEEVRLRHEELTAKLEAMGPVNLVADEEFRELTERLEFLRTQHDDVVGSIKDLEKALRGMTRTAQERFQEAFDDISRHFSDIFSRLFEGGRAELRMVPPEEGEEDPLELGVELMAQPRGKRLQAVTLMSGGEKALTGLALLFAIFYHRPSPFCVLDEVDAPLDDANIHRFLRVLRELCTQTQFVVITHNRKTMDAADVLYGVTMEEPGLSRLVSVRLTET